MYSGRLESLESYYQQWDETIAQPVTKSSSERANSLDTASYSSPAPIVEPVDHFVSAYVLKSIQPIQVSTSLGLVELRQPKSSAQNKGSIIRRWLTEDRKPSYGLGLMSEIFARDLLVEALKRTGEEGLSVHYTPDDLDRSIRVGEGEAKITIQKGGDLIIAKTDDAVLLPLALIDVCLNYTNGLGSRNKKSAGVSPDVESAVMVLGLSDFEFNSSGNVLTAEEYLKRIMRPAILRGQYEPLYGLSSQCIDDVIKGVSQRLIYCCQEFNRHFERHPIGEEHERQILGKLQLIHDVFRPPFQAPIAV